MHLLRPSRGPKLLKGRGGGGVVVVSTLDQSCLKPNKVKGRKGR